MFGGISALFAALAFVGAGAAAYLQWVQLQEERANTRSAMADAAAVKARDDALFARQTFEPLFFKLIELLRARSREMYLQGAVVTSSIHAFDQGLSELRARAAQQFRTVITPDTPSGWVDRLKDMYTTFYHRNESQLGPYFRTLYRIFKLINASKVTEAERVEYANIVRGLLSRDELLLLMLNCCSDYGQKMKVFVNLFGLLKHVSVHTDEAMEVDRKLAETVFSPTARMSHLKRVEYWNANGGKPFPVDD